MGQATAQDWMADTLEAVQIGKALGDNLLVISCSTGSTLSTWLGTTPQAAKVNAFVFISPNFGLKNKMSELINMPWGKQIATAVSGETISYEQTDPREKTAWTGSYPTKALFPMMALVKKVRDSDLSAFKTPVLVLYSAADQTVGIFLHRFCCEPSIRRNRSLKAFGFHPYSHVAHHLILIDKVDQQITAKMEIPSLIRLNSMPG
jgi:alpha-beta hydrolase superfamily lysophospholipase